VPTGRRTSSAGINSRIRAAGRASLLGPGIEFPNRIRTVPRPGTGGPFDGRPRQPWLIAIELHGTAIADLTREERRHAASHHAAAESRRPATALGEVKIERGSG
jgi:hypothetical protein